MAPPGPEPLRFPVELPGGKADPEALDDRLGERIRELRKARRLTLQRLSELTGLSLGYLSQAERGRSKLSVANLMRVAQALDVHLNWFFSGDDEAPEEEREFIVRAGARRKMRFPGLGLTEELLSPSLQGPLEVLMSVIDPGAESGGAYSHKGTEAGVVIEGVLELWIGERYFRLRPGDSFTFPSAVPHRWRNPGRRTARIVWVITPPSY